MPEREAALRLARKITAGIARPVDQVRAIHDWIVLNTAYDYDAYLEGRIPSVAYRATGVIDRGMAVCAGYAETAYLLLDALGIESLVVQNDVHAWNMVKLDGTWYHMDVTWDDPVPNRPGYVRHAYFLISDSRIRKDHDLPDDAPPAPRDWRESEREPEVESAADAGPLTRRWFRLYADGDPSSVTILATGGAAPLGLDRATVKAHFRGLADSEGDPFYRYFPRNGRPLLEFAFDRVWRAKESAPEVNRFVRGGGWLGEEPTPLAIGDRLTLHSRRAGRPVPELSLIVRSR